MSNHPCQIKKYPLLPFSQLVYDMSRLMPKVYTFGCCLRCPGETPNIDRIRQAFRTAIANHPVFNMQADWCGRHFPSPQKDILYGRFHDFNISAQGDDVYIHIRFNRILGDGKSLAILCEDIARAYNGEPLEPDNYWDYVSRYEAYKHDAHYIASQTWLTKEYADSSVPVRPTTDRHWLFTLFPPKAGNLISNLSDLRSKIQSVESEYHLSLDGFVSLCAALAIAEYCGTDDAALTWAYEGRETPEEQRIFGSLHRDIPFQIRKSRIENRESAIRLARNQIRSGIAHSDYPYTLTAPYNKRWNYAVNVLRMAELEDMLRSLDLPIEIVSAPKPNYAYALLDIEIHERADELSLWFRYSTTHYKESSIRRFVSLVRKYAEWLLEE